MFPFVNMPKGIYSKRFLKIFTDGEVTILSVSMFQRFIFYFFAVRELRVDHSGWTSGSESRKLDILSTVQRSRYKAEGKVNTFIMGIAHLYSGLSLDQDSLTY